MAEEVQRPELNGNEEPEIIPVPVTDVIDKVDTSGQCESVLSSGSPDILPEDNINTTDLDKSNKNGEEEKGEDTIILENVPEVLDNLQKELDNLKDGQCPTRVEIDGDTAPFPSQEDISNQNKDQDRDKSVTPDILFYPRSLHPSEEDNTTETEEENTSIETDTEYGDGSYDEHENGPQQHPAVSPSGGQQESHGSRPDIPKHSYSRYDTVSYRKIRKGNTKQRIDEFESMMNL